MDDESPSELAARRELEHVLGHLLDRVIPDDRPSADYIAPVLEGLPMAFEVKEIASPEWLKLQAGLRREQSSLDSERLASRWHVLVTAEPVAASLVGPPSFP
jgi:hypothetical protein